MTNISGSAEAYLQIDSARIKRPTALYKRYVDIESGAERSTTSETGAESRTGNSLAASGIKIVVAGEGVGAASSKARSSRSRRIGESRGAETSVPERDALEVVYTRIATSSGARDVQDEVATTIYAKAKGDTFDRQ